MDLIRLWPPTYLSRDEKQSKVSDQIRDHCGQLQPRPLRHLKTHLPLDLKFRLRPEEDGPEAEQYMGGGTRQNSNVGGRLSASY